MPSGNSTLRGGLNELVQAGVKFAESLSKPRMPTHTRTVWSKPADDDPQVLITKAQRHLRQPVVHALLRRRSAAALGDPLD